MIANAVRDPGLLLAVIDAYFDESGTHKGAKALTVGGFIAPAHQWELFSQLWEEQLASAGVSSYHAADLESSRGEFRGWDRESRIRLQRSFISCMRVIAPWGVASGIRHDEFQNNSHLRGVVKTPYALCAMWCVLEVIDRLKSIGETRCVQFIFDRGAEGLGELAELYNALAEREPLAGPLVFENKTRFLGLQPADFHAYEAWKHLKNRVLDGERFDLRKTLGAAFDACEMDCGFLEAGTCQPLVEELRVLKTLRRTRRV